MEESVGAGGPERFVLDLWDRESASLEDDLARRDFTVNSFAVDLRGGGVADPFGGLGDLEQRTLRATTRGSFEGDPLRVLRLARLLLEWTVTSTDKTEPKVKLSLTHEEIAQIIGTSRETVTRVLADFRKRQIAVLKGSTLTIRNKAVLERLVGA